MRFQPINRLSLAQHATALKVAYPFSEVSIIQGSLRWRDWIQPMALSMRYLVQLTYKIRENPKTCVVKPDLHDLSGGMRIPHLYSQKEQELCVFYPDGREWNSSKAIARTIVPWASEWIIHFESWLFTEKWDGGGTHPFLPVSKPKSETATSTPLL